jgi:hypothetical protein
MALTNHDRLWYLLLLPLNSILMAIIITIRRGCDHMVVGFTTFCAKVVSSNPAHGAMYSMKTVCDKICQWLATDLWVSLISSTNKTDHNDIIEILLKVALNTINLTLIKTFMNFGYNLKTYHYNGMLHYTTNLKTYDYNGMLHYTTNLKTYDYNGI